MAKYVNPDVVYLPTKQIKSAVKEFKTPFFVYEEERIREKCQKFSQTFANYFPGFSPLFAVKANTNPEILKILFSEGFGGDASSEAEAWVTKKLGAGGMYTGNYTTPEEFEFVLKSGLMLNLDDISMLPTVKKIGMPEFLSFRINPGISQGGMKSLFFAGPDAKYGVPIEKAVDAYAKAKRMGVKRFGMHTMTGSNVRDARYFPAVVEKLLNLAGLLKKKLKIDLELINIGGGFGVPYRPEEKPLDIDRVAKSIRKMFDKKCREHGLTEPMLMAEPGRWIMADCGWLVGKVNVIKDSYKKFAGIDAGMNDLPRPAIYDAYHHVTVLGKGPKAKTEKVNIVGRLCENNDQFARDRVLPKVKVGDFIVLHNAGAHAYAMGHNYNNRLRSAEYLFDAKGNFRQIRRAETIKDLFKTTDLKVNVKI